MNTTVLFGAAADHSMEVLDWMRPPDPKREGLAQDKLRGEYLSARRPSL